MRRKLSLLSSGVCPSSGYCAVALTSINSLGSLASWSWCLESVELRLCCWLISRPQGQCWQDWGAGGAGLHVLTVSGGGGLAGAAGSPEKGYKGTDVDWAMGEDILAAARRGTQPTLLGSIKKSLGPCNLGRGALPYPSCSLEPSY